MGTESPREPLQLQGTNSDQPAPCSWAPSSQARPMHGASQSCWRTGPRGTVCLGHTQSPEGEGGCEARLLGESVLRLGMWRAKPRSLLAAGPCSLYLSYARFPQLVCITCRLPSGEQGLQR